MSNWRDAFDDVVYGIGLTAIGAIGITLVGYGLIQAAKLIGFT